MKTKRQSVIILIIAILTISVLIFVLVSSYKVPLPGTWTVAKYNLSGEIISRDNIADAMGDVFSRYNNSQITFTPSGNVELVTPIISQNENSKNATNIIKYEESGDMVELFDDDQFILLERNGKYLNLPLSDDIWIIFEKR